MESRVFESFVIPEYILQIRFLCRKYKNASVLPSVNNRLILYTLCIAAYTSCVREKQELFVSENTKTKHKFFVSKHKTLIIKCDQKRKITSESLSGPKKTDFLTIEHKLNTQFVYKNITIHDGRNSQSAVYKRSLPL